MLRSLRCSVAFLCLSLVSNKIVHSVLLFYGLWVSCQVMRYTHVGLQQHVHIGRVQPCIAAAQERYKFRSVLVFADFFFWNFPANVSVKLLKKFLDDHCHFFCKKNVEYGLHASYSYIPGRYAKTAGYIAVRHVRYESQKFANKCVN